MEVFCKVNYIETVLLILFIIDLFRVPDWRCPSVDSIDFSTMILGFASNFLPVDFYNQYAA